MENLKSYQKEKIHILYKKEWQSWEFPGGLVVRIRHFQCCALGSIPGRGAEIPQAACVAGGGGWEGMAIWPTVDFSTAIIDAGRQWNNIKVLKENNCLLRVLYLTDLSQQGESKIKLFQSHEDKDNLSKIIIKGYMSARKTLNPERRCRMQEQ